MQVRPGAAPGELLIIDGDRRTRVYATVDGQTAWVFHEGVVYEIGTDAPARTRGAAALGSLTAPMPATVLHVKVNVGDTVAHGDVLIILEAMKLELPVRAPGDGRVTAIHCRPGQLVQPDSSLIDIAPREPRGHAEPGRGIA